MFIEFVGAAIPEDAVAARYPRYLQDGSPVLPCRGSPGNQTEYLPLCIKITLNQGSARCKIITSMGEQSTSNAVQRDS